MSVLLLTGGTGALGRALVPLAATRGLDIFVLTRDQAAPAALALLDATGSSNVSLVRGDITANGSLGMEERAAAHLRECVTHVIHCAADTSFTLPLEQARAVNVGGTEAVLRFARECARLEGVACASTVYVAGRRVGLVQENESGGDIERVNSYEQSKHEMEEVVRAAMGTLPVSLFRFSTIIGRADTGAVTVFNSIHHALRLFYQGLAPMIPGDLSTRIDLIPVEFAASALHYLAMQRFEAGRTYHICAGAERSCSLDDLLARTVDVFERVRPAWRKRRIERPAVVDAATYALFVQSVEESGNTLLAHATRAVQSFAWQLAYPKVFATTHADSALAGTGIAAPHVLEYYDKVVSHCVETGWGSTTRDGAAA